jgi:hypothetical protein
VQIQWQRSAVSILVLTWSFLKEFRITWLSPAWSFLNEFPITVTQSYMKFPERIFYHCDSVLHEVSWNNFLSLWLSPTCNFMKEFPVTVTQSYMKFPEWISYHCDSVLHEVSWMNFLSLWLSPTWSFLKEFPITVTQSYIMFPEKNLRSWCWHCFDLPINIWYLPVFWICPKGRDKNQKNNGSVSIIVPVTSLNHTKAKLYFCFVYFDDASSDVDVGY